MTTVNKREQIWQSLSDPEYRHQFVEEEINVGIAFQIRSLRERQKNLTQSDLAKRMGIRQPLVSSWENPNYGKYSLGTLKDLAKAFDVGLLVRFVPFSKMAEWTANLSHDVIAPPSFTEEKDGIDFFRQISEMLETKDDFDKFSDTSDEPIQSRKEPIIYASTATSEGDTIKC
jgi:transcriptional regulator with XRE-family HTH domain